MGTVEPRRRRSHVRGGGHHEPWGDESRNRQLQRVVSGLVVVLTAVIVAALVVQLFR